MAGDVLMMSKSQMEQLAANFARQKETTENVISNIQAGIDSTTWQGGRSDRFRSKWETEFRPSLRALCDALSEYSTFISAELQAGVSALDSV
ncbi:MAG: WXG100 family type VII secretion target [Acidimicrobiaceae bacterium]|nr:WXG100 family type VII secretion target [Acidimicrobiaceae bacterium]